MTPLEIFSRLSDHMLKGLMIHEQLADYYSFLDMRGFADEHERRYREESDNYRSLKRFAMDHYNMLIAGSSVETPKIIPSTWFKYTRYDVDISTKRNAIENGFKEWRDWESKTRSFYEEHYKELMAINEISACLFLEDFIKDVNEELHEIDKQILELKAIDYDLSEILEINNRIKNSK